MNILCSYKKNWNEKTFYVAGVKKKIPDVPKWLCTLYFFVFYTGHTKCLFDAKLFRMDRHFHTNIQKFCLEFFDILKCVKNAFYTTGSSTPVSQNIMSKKPFMKQAYWKWYTTIKGGFFLTCIKGMYRHINNLNAVIRTNEGICWYLNYLHTLFIENMDSVSYTLSVTNKNSMQLCDLVTVATLVVRIKHWSYH